MLGLLIAVPFLFVKIWRGVREAYGAGLENQWAVKSSVGSNPTPVALGEVSEWFKELVPKTRNLLRFVGSNPTLIVICH